MYGGPHTYATYRDDCHAETPGVGDEGRVNFARADTTVDQARIEAVLDSLLGRGAHLLHVGVGNSKLAQRFAHRAARIDGLTVSGAEKAHAESLGLRHYTVHLLNKHSQEFGNVVTGRYDFIIDNNLASFACCKHHFHAMLSSYVGVLKPPGGRILTDQAGMDWYHGELGWPMTYADLVSLERRFRLRAARMTETVYALCRTRVTWGWRGAT